MKDEESEKAREIAAQMEGGVFYRVAYLGILNPDRADLEGSPARAPLPCPFQRQNVLVPLPVATAIAELRLHVGVFAGEESTAEHLGYVAFVSEADALRAAESIAFYADALLRDVERGGYVHFEIEVCACPWEAFGNQPAFDDGRRIRLITVAQPQATDAQKIC